MERPTKKTDGRTRITANGKGTLLEIDLQNDIGPLYRADEIIRAVNGRIAEFRAINEPIIFVQHISNRT
jgi:nicotinamidase-related amidase